MSPFIRRAGRAAATLLVLAAIAHTTVAQCPETWDDAGVPIDDPSPPPPPGTPELTVDGVSSISSSPKSSDRSKSSFTTSRRACRRTTP